MSEGMDSQGIDRQTPIPLHYQVYLKLRDWFTAEFKPGHALPTEIEISEKFGVSRGTVRVALSALAKEGIIDRYPGRGSFLNDQFYVKMKHYDIGVVLSSREFSPGEIWETTWIHNIEVMNGIMKAEGLYNVTTELLAEDTLTAGCNRMFDGFILFRSVSDETSQIITKPQVKVDYTIETVRGCALVAEHAAKAPVSHIAYVGNDNPKRREKIAQVLIAHGKRLRRDHCVTDLHGTVEGGYRACERLFERNVEIDCIICATDLRAIGALNYLRDHGIRVPEEVAVYGFDGTRAGEVTDPPLTTCKFDWKYPGLFAVRKLRAMLDGEPLPTYVPPRGELVVRQSTR